jgi:RNA polymerase sigma factor (TIGR02999 family)
MVDVTQLLSEFQSGDPVAAEKLLPLVYHELRRLAASKFANERPDQTLQATALVHEAYVRLVSGQQQSWQNRGHFFAAAAEAMRRILVDQARRKKSSKAGGGLKRVEITLAETALPVPQLDILALHAALEELEVQDRRAAEQVKLRFFVGLNAAEAAELLGISLSTAKTDWIYAKAWLRVAMRDSP